MAGDWIKMRVDIHDQPEVIGIARRSGLNADSVVGKLLRVWAWADRVTANGIIPHVNQEYIDQLVQSPGFGSAMSMVGWLSDDGESVQIPNFDRHNGESAKKRAQGMNRMQKYRKKQCCDASSVTKASPEKRREEKSNTEYPPTPQGGKAIQIPAELDSPEVRKSFADFVQHRREKKKPVTPTSAKKLFAKFIAAGPVRFAAALEHSIANGWIGVFEPQGQPSKIRSASEFFAGPAAFAAEDVA